MPSHLALTLGNYKVTFIENMEIDLVMMKPFIQSAILQGTPL